MTRREFIKEVGASVCSTAGMSGLAISAKQFFNLTEDAYRRSAVNGSGSAIDRQNVYEEIKKRRDTLLDRVIIYGTLFLGGETYISDLNSKKNRSRI